MTGRCDGKTCTDSDHDHFEDDGLPMRCVDCAAPCHYDYRSESYRHDHDHSPTEG